MKNLGVLIQQPSPKEKKAGDGNEMSQLTEAQMKKKKENAASKLKITVLQGLDLESKVALTLKRIREWYEHWDGDVYISWSKGKDSTILAYLVWSIYPDVPAIFSDTGLEYPEIKSYMPDFAIGREIVRVRPKKTFKQVINEDGVALLSKKWAKAIRVLKEKSPKTEQVRKLHLTGINGSGNKSNGWKLPNKYHKLIDADIKISEKCCDHLKKAPFIQYEKDTGRKPFSGSLAAEGGNRKFSTQKCNAFTTGRPISNPLLFWNEEDIWAFAEDKGIRFSEIYYERVNEAGETLPPEQRTGCMFCMFGVQLEEGENRFQRMHKSHPRHWDTCINKLGLKHALDLIDVKYIPSDKE